MKLKKERNVQRAIKRSNIKCIGHTLRRGCFSRHVVKRKIEGRIKVTGRRCRRHKRLLDGFRALGHTPAKPEAGPTPTPDAM